MLRLCGRKRNRITLKLRLCGNRITLTKTRSFGSRRPSRTSRRPSRTDRPELLPSTHATTIGRDWCRKRVCSFSPLCMAWAVRDRDTERARSSTTCWRGFTGIAKWKMILIFVVMLLMSRCTVAQSFRAGSRLPRSIVIRSTSSPTSWKSLRRCGGALASERDCLRPRVRTGKLLRGKY